MSVDDRGLRDAQAAALQALRDHPTVLGVGFGAKEVGGRSTGRVALKVVVARRLPPEGLRPGERIPPSIAGIDTDVIEVGPFHPITDPSPSPPPGTPMWGYDHHFSDYVVRPLIGGVSIGTFFSTTQGTLGAMLVDANSSRVFGLTNQHVIQIKRAAGDPPTLPHPVYQPRLMQSQAATGWIGPMAALDGAAKTIIGTVVHEAPPRPDDELEMLSEPTPDAALIELNTGLQWRATVEAIGPIRGRATITVQQIIDGTAAVRKVGARSGLTGGRVIMIGGQWISSAGHPPVPASPSTNDLVIEANPSVARGDYGPEVSTFTNYGDSGSVVVDNANRIVGLTWGIRPYVRRRVVRGFLEYVELSEDNIPPEPGQAIADSIEAVLAFFNDQPALGLALDVASTDAVGDRVIDAPLMTVGSA